VVDLTNRYRIFDVNGFSQKENLRRSLTMNQQTCGDVGEKKKRIT